MAGLDRISALFQQISRSRRLPFALCFALVLAGLAWLLMLPLDDYSRRTYISENALLPGQAHAYFSGREHDVFRAYRQEVADLVKESPEDRSVKIASLFADIGVKSEIQNYTYPGTAGSPAVKGQNVYALLEAPRADKTEAIVLIAAWKNMDNQINYSGIALALSMARYFSRWSIWAKNIIFIVPGDSMAGPQAWVDAYHSQHDEQNVDPIKLKAGALQGAVALDYDAGPWGRRFDKLIIHYDGVNGALPNLDLVNAAAVISQNAVKIRVAIQNMIDGQKTYQDKLRTMATGMAKQGLGFSSGPHSPFVPYHISAITLQAVGDGWQDEMSFGKSVEAIFRSLNNLLEHFHQSFFFYFLVSVDRFVSIGTYLPSAMGIAASFTIMSIFQWIRSRVSTAPSNTITWPVLYTLAAYGSGTALILASAHLSPEQLAMFLKAGSAGAIAASTAVSYHLITADRSSRSRLLSVFHALTLLMHGMLLATLATVNFSASVFIGVLTSPFIFMDARWVAGPSRGLPGRALSAVLALGWVLLGPAVFTRLVAGQLAGPIADLAVSSHRALSLPGSASALRDLDPFVLLLALVERGWRINGTWLYLIACLVWWPAWAAGLVMCMAPFSLMVSPTDKEKQKKEQ